MSVAADSGVEVASGMGAGSGSGSGSGAGAGVGSACFGSGFLRAFGWIMRFSKMIGSGMRVCRSSRARLACVAS